MNSKQLEYAIELSKSLNFSVVAEKFNISQPALSKQISNLEKNIGVTLFNRHNTPIELTAAGEYFFKEAKDLLYKEEQLYRSMEDFASGEKGNLTIGISPFRALYFIPKIAKMVKDKFHGVKIVLQEDTSDVLRKKASEGKFDFAIVNLPVDESLLEVIPIGQDTLVIAIPKSMEKLIGISAENSIPQVDFKKFENIPFIVVGQNQEMRHLFEKNCSVADIKPNIAMEVVGLSTAWAMVRAGIGATLLPLEFVKEMNIDNSISLFIPKCDTNIRRPAIVYRRGQHISKYAKYAMDLLKNNK